MNKRIFLLVFSALALAIAIYPPTTVGRMMLFSPRFVERGYWGWDSEAKRSTYRPYSIERKIDWSRYLAECAAACAIAGVAGAVAGRRKKAR